MANPRTYTEGVFQVSNCSAAASESESRVESSRRRRKEMGENVETEEELLGKEGGRHSKAHSAISGRVSAFE